jgi:ankyrin repeat protein
MVKLLLQHGANSQKAIGGAAKKDTNIDAKNWSGRTALYMAAKTGNRDIVQLLIEEGADIEAADFDLETPLSAALKNSHMDVVKLLREKGAHFGEGEQNLSTDMCTD